MQCKIVREDVKLCLCFFHFPFLIIFRFKDEATKDSKYGALSPTKVVVSKNLTAKAAELANILKYNCMLHICV